MSGATEVFLLDDHEIVRNGVKVLLDAHDDLVVVGEAASVTEAMDVVRRCRPHVAVIDVRLHDGSGIDVCRQISEEFPETRSLVLTAFDTDRIVAESRMAGAAGLVMKEIRGPDLVDAIRAVAAGRQLLDDAGARAAMRRFRESEEGRLLVLTAQEQRILRLVGEGLSNQQIAERMDLAEKTVRNYVSNLLNKLGLARRSQIAAMSARIDARRERDG